MFIKFSTLRQVLPLYLIILLVMPFKVFPDSCLDLNGNWKFRQVGKTHWLPAVVPGTVHTDLMNNQIIQDPYYRLNEHYVQWIDKVDWEYTSEFETDDTFLKQDVIELICEGLDTYADVYINDSLVLNADNMFRQWKTDVKKVLKPGKNQIRILFRSPIHEGLKLLEANGYPLPASNDQSANGDLANQAVSIFTRKAGYHYGWDWGPRLVTSGIWRPVKLHGWNRLTLENVHIIQDKLTRKRAELTGKLTISSLAGREAEVVVKVDAKEVKTLPVKILQGIHEYPVSFQINNPELWWTNELGSQKLYRIEFSIREASNELSAISEKIGLRTIKLIREADPDGKGESFLFELNGVRVFAKGVNYIPNDLFLPRVTPEKYKEIVKSAADAHMNMIRVWGGGVYENDLFYDLCDQFGILVWQDFMFACSMYPGGRDFFENVRQEAVDNVVRLRKHPCMALWCGNNEIEVAWAEYKEKSGWGWKEQYTREQRQEIWANYDTIFHQILPEVVGRYSGGLAYWHSSPSAGMGELSTYTSAKGDMHYWGVWHGQHPFTDFRKYKARFMSEYGFQSFPEPATVEKYTLRADRNIESDVMASHQRSGIGNLRIKQYMEDDYIVPSDFDQFLYVGQLLQAQAITTAIESHRAEMPYCMGSLYWQLNDCWPVASWSGIDWYGRWKALHYAVKDAFKQDIVAAVESDGKIEVKVITDRLERFKAKLLVSLCDFRGNVIWNYSGDITIKANTSGTYHVIDLENLPEGFDRSAHYLKLEIKNGDKSIDKAVLYFVKSKELKLPDPELKLNVAEKGEQFEIRITGSALIKNLFVTTTATEAQFSDNFMDILPGETKMLTIPANGISADVFLKSLKTLHLYQTTK